MRQRDIISFRRSLLNWYRTHRVDLPWRHTRDPYKILVSEVMLQQTQVDRVKVKWPQFLQEFPTFKSLSRAPVSKVIRAWSGMGYNRRALYLQKTAQAVERQFNGKFPQTLESLRTLSGVGEYTARALCVFAFGQPYIAPDVNVLRILRRSFGKDMKRRREEEMKKRLIAIGDKIVTPKNAYDMNQALMDLGRTICTAKNPKDGLCPLHTHSSLSDEFVTKRRKKAEPTFGGVPRRIWRGRIVELVRGNGSVARSTLSDHLGIQNDPESHQWLEGVLRQLGTDGLLATTEEMVTLP